VKSLSAQNRSISNTHPEAIFPKRRNESDTTFAKRPTISKKERKSDNTISKNFTSG